MKGLILLVIPVVLVLVIVIVLQYRKIQKLEQAISESDNLYLALTPKQRNAEALKHFERLSRLQTDEDYRNLTNPLAPREEKDHA